MKCFSLKNLLSSKKKLFIFAIIISAVVIFHRLGEAYLAGDDCYYSEIAKEMVKTGDYLSPHNGYKVDFHTSKPPMLFWMNALSGKIFGFNSFGMRLPSAVLGFAGMIALFIFVSRYFNPYTAFMSVLILTFTQQYLYHLRSAVTDGPFAVFFMLSLISFWAARAENKNVFYYLSGLFAGLAVMTRQIPGLFIFVVIFAYIFAAKEFNILKKPHFYGGILLSIIVFMPWHILMYQRHGVDFLKQYFGVALMTGIKGYPASYSGNPSLNPWYAYYEILLSNYWPWLPFLVAGYYKVLKNYKNFTEEEKKRFMYMFSWSLTPLAIFQIAKVKQYHYIVPLYAPFAVIAASAIDSFNENIKNKITSWIVILILVLTAAYLFFPIIPKTLDSREFNDTILLVDEVKKTGSDIIALDSGFCHYSSCFWFYADRNTVKNSEEEIIQKIKSGKKFYYVLEKGPFEKISKLAGIEHIKIVKSSEKSVLFTNSGEK